jgi:hypothetical protein
VHGALGLHMASSGACRGLRRLVACVVCR